MKYKIISIKDNEKKLTDIVNILGNYFAVEGLWEKDDSWDIYLSGDVTDDALAISADYVIGARSYSSKDHQMNSP